MIAKQHYDELFLRRLQELGTRQPDQPGRGTQATRVGSGNSSSECNQN